MKKFCEAGLDSKTFWEERAVKYSDEMNNSYHKERINVITKLMKNLVVSNMNVLDFGCGGAEITDLFFGDAKNCNITGIDISSKFIEFAQKRFAERVENTNFFVGNIDDIKKFDKETFDIIFSFNVLAYLNKAEEKEFYSQCFRILKKNGSLLISHSNELFDLYTANSHTVNFYKNNFSEEKRIKTLFSNFDVPKRSQFEVRANPLNFGEVMLNYGFKEIEQGFSHFHSLPPLLMEDDRFEKLPEYDLINKWKLMFQCSIYYSKLKKI